jgi:cardiolipin synthase A/B
MPRLSSLSLLATSLIVLAGCGGGGTASGSPPQPPTSPQLALSATSLSFGSVLLGQTSATQTLTLTNSGTATMSISGITLGGTNASSFAETSACGTSLAVNASCTLSVTFTPAAASTYSATITIADNVSGSPQTVSLSGTGTSAPAAHTLYTFPESDNSVTPLYALINSAQKTIDMTMYALEDTTFSADLVTACQRGVKVRVILDQNDEKSGNTATFNQLNAQANCSAVWANTAFEATHEKSFVVDGAEAAIMTLNLQSQYYSTTRDFAMVETDAADIAAIEGTFNADYAAGTTNSGTVGASDFSYVPGLGDDLIWSPTTAQTAMVNIIANAQKTLLIENEEMASSASYIISALEAACQRGVTVQIAMVDQSDYESNFVALEKAGCGVHTYPDTSNGFYIHAKAVVADYGLSTQSVYMGSINYSNASMNSNRELGMYVSDSASVQAINTTMAQDYAGGTAYPTN